MPLEGRVRQLFEEIKYHRKFPPRETAALIKSKLAVQGLGNSGAAVEQVSAAYLQAVESILNKFTDVVISKSSALGLTADADLRAVIAEAHQQLFNEARGALIGEFRGNTDDYRKLAMATLDERRGAVWDHLERRIELRKLEEPVAVEKKEREQKFGILLSAAQAVRDFEAWASEARKWDNPIAIFFVDLDHFKALNDRLTHTKVDQTILPQVQRLLAKLVQSRGEAYRYGGEEFVLIMPNLDAREACAFAEKVRETFEQYHFGVEGEVETITVSVGAAVWPENGGTYQEVLEVANRAEVEAKQTRNTIKVAGAQ